MKACSQATILTPKQNKNSATKSTNQLVKPRVRLQNKATGQPIQTPFRPSPTRVQVSAGSPNQQQNPPHRHSNTLLNPPLNLTHLLTPALIPVQRLKPPPPAKLSLFIIFTGTPVAFGGGDQLAVS
ncbi:hypothetical protein SUGI_0132760 [Cryptomeria japonica]|nr:hypothetical protein SUGI_0132760 [Cryptomeria japonica]